MCKEQETLADLDMKQVLSAGLLAECPFGGNPRNCPLHTVRTWALSDRSKYLDLLTPAEIAHLTQHHRRCFARKQRRLAQGYDSA